MDDLMTVLQRLGEDVGVEERWSLILKEGRRVNGYATKAAAASAASVGDKVVRQVRLASEWADVAE